MPNNRQHPGITKKGPTKRHPYDHWLLRYRDPDNATRRRTFDTKQEAMDFQASVRTAKRTGDWIDDKLARTPFKEVAEHWYVGTEDLQPTTRAAYRSMLNTYILPGLGHHAVGKITPSLLRTFMAELPEKLSATRKRHVFRTLVPIFNLAVDDGMIRTSPTAAKSVKQRVPKPQQKKMLFLDAGQVDALAAAITPRYRTLVYFAAYTGMRAGELVALRVKHLDLKRGRVTVEESVSDVNGYLKPGPTKNRKTREFGIPTFLVTLLKDHLGDRQANREAYVFGEDSKPMRHGNFYGRHFKPAVAEPCPMSSTD
jgi:integrase